MEHDGRRAAIDLGTVTCRLLVADIEDGRITELLRRCEIVNLGMDVDRTGVLRDDAIARTVSQIRSYVADVRSLEDAQYPFIPIAAVATSAARDATNSDVLVDALRSEGVDLHIIPGEREAALSFRGASRGHEGEHLLVADIGGGSTEIVFGRGGSVPSFAHSFNVGCRRVTERFLHSDPPTQDELAKARAWVRTTFAPVFAEVQRVGNDADRIVAVAGTATSAVSVREHMEIYDPARVDGTMISHDDLASLCEQLRQLPLCERERVVGLEPKRAPVIVAGLGILLEVMDAARLDSFTVSESDILQGLILEGLGV